MATRARRAVAALCTAAVGCWAAASAGASSRQQPVFRGAVEQVRLDASVVRGSTPVNGLRAEHFEVRDNGVVHPVDYVLQEEVPLRLLLVLDTSSSLAGEGLRALSAAAQSLVRSLRPDDEAGLVTFSQVLHLAVAPTRVQSDVLAALGRLRAGGATAWRDALFVGLQLAGTGTQSRPVVLLFTDGGDSASWMDVTNIDDVVRRSNVVVHAVGLTPRFRDARGRLPRSLDLSIAAGGGRFWAAEDPSQLGDRFVTVLKELRARYLLGYTPATPPAPGWHDVRVSLKSVRGEVRARPGYFVPAR